MATGSLEGIYFGILKLPSCSISCAKRSHSFIFLIFDYGENIRGKIMFKKVTLLLEIMHKIISIQIIEFPHIELSN